MKLPIILSMEASGMGMGSDLMTQNLCLNADCGVNMPMIITGVFLFQRSVYFRKGLELGLLNLAK